VSPEAKGDSLPDEGGIRVSKAGGRRSPWVTDRNAALLTDLYELTMLQAYWSERLFDEAVFSLFVRRLPERRNYLLACGLEDVLRYLEKLRFDAPGIRYLATLPGFAEPFLQWLGQLRFTGTVFAVPEGTPVFAAEPILEVVAPLPEAQIVETFVMNQIHLQTVLASKAARFVAAAAGRPIVDFGLRRMHGTDAGLKAARAFHIAGVSATSNLLAGQVYGIPVSGTMGHSYVQAHEDEAEAFRAFARLYPETILLVDTYDTVAGVERVVALARELGKDFRVRGLRLDSGDLAQLAFEARRILDGAGLTGVQIFASGGLTEERISDLLARGAPVDAFGVGTEMGVSHDEPALDIAYKLTAYGGAGRLKLSPGKGIVPGRKQVFRLDEGGRAVGDTIARAEERLPGRPLLEKVLENGKRLPAGRRGLARARRRAKEEVAKLPETVQGIAPAELSYAVTMSAELEAYRREITEGLLS
jgi:nicotinate phosphoribosyltransferase